MTNEFFNVADEAHMEWTSLVLSNQVNNPSAFKNNDDLIELDMKQKVCGMRWEAYAFVREFRCAKRS